MRKLIGFKVLRNLHSYNKGEIFNVKGLDGFFGPSLTVKGKPSHPQEILMMFGQPEKFMPIYLYKKRRCTHT